MARFCVGCGHPLGDDVAYCDKCGKKSVGLACKACGTPMTQGEQFCKKCGAAATGAALPQPAPARRAPVQNRKVPPQQRPAVQAAAPVRPQKESKTGLFVGFGLVAVFVVVGLLAVGGVAAVFLLNKPPNTAGPSASSAAQSRVELHAFPEELKIDAANVKVNCNYRSPDSIIPANYRSLDHVVYMQCWTDRGRTSVMVSVEIPEFTQKYEQKIDVSRAETELIIHPPLLDGASGQLNSSKDAQLVITVKDINSGNIVLQDTKSIKLYSRFDMQWADSDGTPYYENILAWVTPEAPEVKQLLRLSADSCNELTNGGLNAIIGYQQNGDWSQDDITYTQVFCMMHALASKFGVKYIMSPFSSTSSGLQRVATPAEVINSAGGLCAETAVTMASAIAATNMHAVLILLPGHMQVAVETWYNSGEYYLIETTALDAALNAPTTYNWDAVVSYMNKEQWTEYLSREGYVAIDCDLAEQLQIKSID